MINGKSTISRAILRLWTPRAEIQRAVYVAPDGTVQLSPAVNFSLSPAGSSQGVSSLPATAGQSGQSA